MVTRQMLCTRQPCTPETGTSKPCTPETGRQKEARHQLLYSCTVSLSAHRTRVISCVTHKVAGTGLPHHSTWCCMLAKSPGSWRRPSDTIAQTDAGPLELDGMENNGPGSITMTADLLSPETVESCICAAECHCYTWCKTPGNWQ